jgi:hypothetical protein
VFLDHFLEVGSAEFKDQVLCGLTLLVLGVVDVEELDDVLAASKPVEYLVLATHVFPCLSRTLHGHSFLVQPVVGLKDIT